MYYWYPSVTYLMSMLVIIEVSIPFSSSPVSRLTWVLRLYLITPITSSVPPEKSPLSSSTTFPTSSRSIFLSPPVKPYSGFWWSSFLKSMKKLISLREESSMICFVATTGSKPGFTWLLKFYGTYRPLSINLAILEARYLRFSSVSGCSVLLVSESSALDFCISLLMIVLILGWIWRRELKLPMKTASRSLISSTSINLVSTSLSSSLTS